MIRMERFMTMYIQKNNLPLVLTIISNGKSYTNDCEATEEVRIRKIRIAIPVIIASKRILPINSIVL